MKNIDTINKKLEQIALKISTPFCYSCYLKAPSGVCEKCFSDDLMLSTSEGVEYGTLWIVENYLNEHLSPIKIDNCFEDHCREIYSETTTIGWMEFDTIQVMKDQDPISWNIAKSEYLDNLLEDEIVITFDENNYFWISDVENLVDDFERNVMVGI